MRKRTRGHARHDQGTRPPVRVHGRSEPDPAEEARRQVGMGGIPGTGRDDHRGRSSEPRRTGTCGRSAAKMRQDGMQSIPQETRGHEVRDALSDFIPRGEQNHQHPSRRRHRRLGQLT